MKNNLKSSSIEEIQSKSKDEQIEILEQLIRYHNNKYFLDNSPEISDQLFDEYTILLKSLKPQSTVLFELIGETGSIIHPEPMLSIDKRYSHSDIIKWIESISDEYYIIEPKYDGMAARYQNAILSTRGNGTQGEDISNRLGNLTIIGELPVDNTISVYGEVIIPLSYFSKNLYPAYKNPRNAVVGIMKAKTLKDEGVKALLEGGVHFVLHDQAYQLKVTGQEIIEEDRWEEILEEMFHQDYPLDGIVIKATNPTIIQKLGRTEHHSKFQVAYKSPAERKWTKVLAITDQVGRTGRITSVANVEPIELSGVTVTNVTLHNYEYLIKSRIGIGSRVEIMRSGEVIPFITNVIPADKPHIPRSTCPSCNTELKINGKYIECINDKCPAKQSLSIEYFFKTLDVEELGAKTIEKFMNELKINKITDFYDIKPDQITKIEGFGEKSANKITNNVQSTLNGLITPTQLLQALGIKEIGPATSKWIINKYGFENLDKLSLEELQSVKGIGKQKAEHFLNSIHAKWWIVEDLLKRGLFFKESKMSSKLNGLKVAITGDKSTLTREQLITLIEENGGEYKTSVTNDLDYLIAGDNAGSKLEKAKTLRVKIISESDFLNLLN